MLLFFVVNKKEREKEHMYRILYVCCNYLNVSLNLYNEMQKNTIRGRSYFNVRQKYNSVMTIIIVDVCSRISNRSVAFDLNFCHINHAWSLFVTITMFRVFVV
jgi:hypothetical protein